jgi:hypothetical protein
MQRRLHSTVVGGASPARRRVIGASKLNHLTFVVLDHLVTRDEVRAAQSHFTTRRQAKELLGWNLHEVFALDVQLP